MSLPPQLGFPGLSLTNLSACDLYYKSFRIINYALV
jgi:hypothetical protein